MISVLKREVYMYFQSMTAYVFGAFLLLFTGIGALVYNIHSSIANFELVLNFISMIFIVIIPILTMRIISEEHRQKTDQLLYSLPISSVDVIVGKFLALMLVFLVPMLIISFCPLIFKQYGDVFLPTSYGSIFAFILLGMTLISIGMFVSSLTESQGMAAGICVAVMLLIYYSDTLADHLPWAKAGEVIHHISLFGRFQTFVYGVFDVTAIIYFFTVTVFFLYLTVQSFDSRRYNG